MRMHPANSNKSPLKSFRHRSLYKLVAHNQRESCVVLPHTHHHPLVIESRVVALAAPLEDLSVTTEENQTERQSLERASEVSARNRRHLGTGQVDLT